MSVIQHHCITLLSVVRPAMFKGFTRVHEPLALDGSGGPLGTAGGRELACAEP